MFDKLRPLGDRILVKRLENQEVTVGGIIIPDTAKEKAQTGTVVSVGTGKTDNTGKFIPVQVKKGDVVYFGKYAGAEAGDNHLILREDEVLGVVDKE
jgi:chaperonin GroES